MRDAAGLASGIRPHHETSQACIAISRRRLLLEAERHALHMSQSNTCIAQADIIPAARALGVGIIAWGPLGNGALTERWQTRDDMPPLDRRRRLPRFSEENFSQVGLAAAGMPT